MAASKSITYKGLAAPNAYHRVDTIIVDDCNSLIHIIGNVYASKAISDAAGAAGTRDRDRIAESLQFGDVLRDQDRLDFLARAKSIKDTDPIAIGFDSLRAAAYEWLGNSGKALDGAAKV